MVQLLRHVAPHIIRRHVRTSSLAKGSDYPTRSPYDDAMNTFNDIVKETVAITGKPVDVPSQHHFNTYTIVQDLQAQGFSKEQAVVIMKGMKFKLRERYFMSKVYSSVHVFILFNSVSQLHQELLLKSALENVRNEPQKNA